MPKDHHRRSFCIEPGTKGFLVSCFRGREAVSVTECYKILEEYREKFYLEESNEFKTDKNQDISKHLEIEDQMAQEISQLRQTKNKAFLSLSMGDLQCLVFFKMAGPMAHVKPSEFCQKMFKDLSNASASGRFKARYCQRIIPIDYTCYANSTDFSKLARICIDESFPMTSENSRSTYALQIESRFNNSISKEEIIQIFTQMVPSCYRVQFKVPDLTVVVQVFKNIVGLSVVCNYDSFRKFNLQQCAKSVLRSDGI